MSKPGRRNSYRSAIMSATTYFEIVIAIILASIILGNLIHTTKVTYRDSTIEDIYAMLLGMDAYYGHISGIKLCNYLNSTISKYAVQIDGISYCNSTNEDYTRTIQYLYYYNGTMHNVTILL